MIYFYAILSILDFIAIILVINEDVFYEVEDKVFKIFWILLIPFFGAIFAMIKLNSLHNYTGTNSQHNTNDNSHTYEFFDSSGGMGGGE